MEDKKTPTVDELQKEIVALRELSSKHAEDANTSKAQVLGLKGDLERALESKSTLEAQVAQLQSEVKRLGGEIKSGGQRLHRDLPKGAFEMSESVTIANVAGHRVSAQPHDVVFVVNEKDAEKDVAALQKKLGERHRVVAVTSAQLNELRGISAIHT